MIKETKEKINEKNKIVGWWQKGLLSDQEYKRMLEAEEKAQAIEKEWHNADLMQDEMEEISWQEAHGAVQTEEGWEI